MFEPEFRGGAGRGAWRSGSRRETRGGGRARVRATPCGESLMGGGSGTSYALRRGERKRGGGSGLCPPLAPRRKEEGRWLRSLPALGAEEKGRRGVGSVSTRPWRRGEKGVGRARR